MSTCELSLEFFPPRQSAQLEQFPTVFNRLVRHQPDWISMTWGALGSDSEASLVALETLSTMAHPPIAAHLTCSGQSASSVRSMIRRVRALGVERFVALRGDALNHDNASGLLQHASELVTILREEGVKDISVAAYPEGHPESPDLDTDLQHLREKLDAGASRALTQFFFEPELFLRWRDRAVAMGIDKPLVPGIMPIHDIDKVMVFAARCGANVPRLLQRDFERLKHDPTASHQLAVEQTLSLCQTLQQEGVSAFHLYTLNRVDLAEPIAAELRNTVSPQHRPALHDLIASSRPGDVNTEINA